MALLSIENLTIQLSRPDGEVAAVDHVNLSLAPDDTIGLVGESGCGKTLTALAVMGLLPEHIVRVTSGRIRFKGEDLLAMSRQARRRIRGRRIGMIFQEPYSALNPLMTVGRQISEAVQLDGAVSRRQAWQQAAFWLRQVRMPDADRHLRSYPHELSGGMRQRVLIAMALAGRPDLLIADEPTTALDASLQARIMNLIGQLASNLGMALLLISHDLTLVARRVRRVAVMYAGTVVEAADADTFFDQAFHPYTRALLRAVPAPRSSAGASRRLQAVGGTVPAPGQVTQGCRFAPRCPQVFEPCRQMPDFIRIGPGHRVRCWLKAFPEKAHVPNRA